MKMENIDTHTIVVPQKELLYFVRLGLPGIIKAIKSEEERIIDLTNLVTNDYDGRLDHIRIKYDDLLIRYEEIRSQVLQNILKIKTPTQREVMYSYIIEGKTWETISNERCVCFTAVSRAYSRALNSYIEMFDNEAEIDSDLYTQIKAS